MKFTWLAAASLLACASPVLAEEAPSPSQAAVAPGPAEQPVDPERLALAHELMASLDAKKTLSGMFTRMLQAMPSPSSTADDKLHLRQSMLSMGAGLDAVMPEILDAEAVIYARVFTAQELKDAAAFYRTPSGHALIEKLPLVTQQAVPITLQFMPKVVSAAEKDFCSHVACTDADHAGYAKERERMSDLTGARQAH